jgi:hypothetical protein
MSFDVRLMDQGNNKINTIRAVRSAFSPMGLYEAKTTVDQAPITIARGVSSEQVEAIRHLFQGIAKLEVLPNSSSVPLSKFNRVVVELPRTGPNWVDIADLKLGEIVTTSNTLVSVNHEDLRIITESGAMGLDGKIKANFSDGTAYQRLPIGTKVSLTVN